MEADPFTWAIPRLEGAVKAALVQIQADEYGGGDARWMHSQLFADTMAAMGLDPGAGPPVDRLPGTILVDADEAEVASVVRKNKNWTFSPQRSASIAPAHQRIRRAT